MQKEICYHFVIIPKKCVDVVLFLPLDIHDGKGPLFCNDYNICSLCIVLTSSCTYRWRMSDLEHLKLSYTKPLCPQITNIQVTAGPHRLEIRFWHELVLVSHGILLFAVLFSSFWNKTPVSCISYCFDLVVYD